MNGPGQYATFSARATNDAGEPLGSLPCYRPPWPRLVAVDANTGETLWETVPGITPGLPPEKSRTGGSGSTGPTAAAGGLVFIGATNDRRFRAFDARSGEELWSGQLDAVVNANPMTYCSGDGKQYVTVLADDTLRAFALP